MRFCLVDRIVEIDAGKSVTAIRNLTLGEEYLADHFPGFAVMPGVLMLETMVQASAWLMRYTEDFRYSMVLLKEARAIKFNNFVTPGRSLRITSSLHSRDDTTCTFKASGTVDDTSTVSARLILEQFNLCDRDLG